MSDFHESLFVQQKVEQELPQRHKVENAKTFSLTERLKKNKTSPDVKVGEHLQIDDGFWDALDAVVVEVEGLQGGEQTHFRGDFCQVILR